MQLGPRTGSPTCKATLIRFISYTCALPTVYWDYFIVFLTFYHFPQHQSEDHMLHMAPSSVV